MLNKIIETKKQEVANLVLPDPVQVEKVSFLEALANSNRMLSLIAEVKKHPLQKD